MLHQAVSVTLDPPLEVQGHSVWQLLRPAAATATSTPTPATAATPTPTPYTIETSQDIVENHGFILVAMNNDGSPAKDATTNSLMCLAPSLSSTTVLLKPISKNSVALAPFSQHQQQQRQEQQHQGEPFVWKTERFHAGGVAFSTTLHTVRSWLANRAEEKKKKEDADAITSTPIKDPAAHYITDDARLYSTAHTDGEVVGFEMRLAFPPIVDVTDFLAVASSGSPAAEAVKTDVASVARNLVDAAIDCGFFLAVIRHDAGRGLQTAVPASSLPRGKEDDDSVQAASGLVSSTDAHCAAQRLLDVIRKSFGRCICVREEQEARRDDDDDDDDDAKNDDEQDKESEQGQEQEETTSLLPVSEPLEAKLTKVTLKSTTGIVKTEFNPPRFAAIEHPLWLRHLSRICGEADHSQFLHYHSRIQCCSGGAGAGAGTGGEISEEKRSRNNNNSLADLSTYFHFGEELAARMVAALLLGVSPTMKHWPSDEQKQQQRSLRDVEPTKLSFSDALPPRVEPSQFYSLFRAVSYPPSKTGFASNDFDYGQEEDDDDDDDDDDENIRSSNSSRSSSHRSSDTDDSEGRALYEHTDKDWITLLCAAPSLCGLQVVDANGSTFTDMKMPAHILRQDRAGSLMCLICNIGDAFQMVSRGNYVSRTHRARNPRNEMTRGAQGDGIQKQRCKCESCRVSLPLFIEPSPQRWPVAYESEKSVLFQL